MQFGTNVIKQSYSNWKFQLLNVMEDQHPSAYNTRDTECKLTITEDEGEDHNQYYDGGRIHKVHKLLRSNKHKEDDSYAPKLVSFGPYYHGLPQLAMVEKLKHEVLEMLVSSSGKDKQFFYCQIFKVIDQIRNCYVGVSRDDCDDRALAEMILLDASFSIYLLKLSVGEEEEERKLYRDHFTHHLGIALLHFAFEDLFLLENQIPLWVIELLNRLIRGNKEEGPRLIWKFLKQAVLQDGVQISTTEEDKTQPLHFVGALHELLVEEWDNAGKRTSSNCLKNIIKSKCQWWTCRKKICLKNIIKSKCQWWTWRKKNPYKLGEYNRQSRSVTDLKAKGIHFKPSSYCLKDIKFKSSTFYGQLQLPIRLFSAHSEQYFEQMIAYEVSPESYVGFPVTCYVNFLKSLIVKSEDVKELREKKILFSTLDSDEQVVEVIKRINTCGMKYDIDFDDVKKEIEKHCSSKAKTWIAELINTYFRNPWTVIALVAATFLLCLTFLQTYYTMKLPN